MPVHSGIRLAIYSPQDNKSVGEEVPAGHEGAHSMRMFRYGERIRFLARLRRPRNFRNPGAFDYQGYLAERGIAALGSAKVQEIELLPALPAAGWNGGEPACTGASSQKCTSSGRHGKQP